MERRRTAVIGGGAAGFFAAINLKEMLPEMEVTIFEQGEKVLRKVRVSGGGRCNCTNSFEDVSDLSQVYPRGHRLLKRLFKVFNHKDAYQWFENHGVELTTQEDQCVFPKSQNSQTIINTFLYEAKRNDITIVTGRKITSLDELKDYDYIILTTGGAPKEKMLEWTENETVSSVPSLFSFNINDTLLQSLTGTVIPNVTAFIPGTKMRSTGPLLITHWGMSGPAILKLSSYGARYAAECNYKFPLNINWMDSNEEEAQQMIHEIMIQHPNKKIRSISVQDIPTRLWTYLTDKCLKERSNYCWKDLNKKEINRLTNQLCNDNYMVEGRAVFKEEFVTCGGIALTAINPSTLESKTIPNLYFAGEVLDIDGITGGFNFQAAWTTAYNVAHSIAVKEQNTLFA